MLKKPWPIPEWVKKTSTAGLVIGVLALFSSLIFADPKRAGFAYLVPFVYFLFLSLGALFFLAVQFISNAGWSVNIRRIMEALTAYLPFSALLLAPLVYYGFHVYEWFHDSAAAVDPILKGKSAYLNVPFFLVRLAVFFSVWVFFAYKLIQFSARQDKDGQVLWTKKLTPWSVGFLLFFVPSFSLLSVDLLMSLDTHWFSTIFGVYTFAGAFQSALAVMILLAVYFIPRSNGLINENHLHDLGKFLMGMTLFWAYIAFSQYMLIWYANLPEETTFFVPRSKAPWMWVSIFLLVFKFAVPFICLLPRWVKRNTKTISAVSVLILISQYVDIYWLVYPAFDPDSLQWGWLDFGFFAMFFGLFLFSVFSFFEKYAVIPLKDPRGHESSSHHVAY